MSDSTGIRIGATPSSAFPLPVSSSGATPQSSEVTHIRVAKQKEWNTAISTSIRSRLSKLCREGQPHLARHLLEALPRPSTAVWNSVIIGFICNSMPIEALHVYAKMRSTPDTRFDPYTFSSTLKACALTHDLMAGKAIHSHFLRSYSNSSNPGPSRIVYNSLLNMYSSCQHHYVLKVFDVMRKRNVVAWNTLISWHAKTNRYFQALHVFTTMIKNSLTPTPVTFVNLFPAVSKFRDSRIAHLLYGFLLKFGDEYMNDVFVVSSAIIMFSDLGCIDYARMVFDQCSHKNTEVWNTMIAAYVQNNLPIQAIDVFIQALVEEKEGVCDDVTFLSVITAVSQLQQINLVEQLHAFVLKSFPNLSIIILNAIIVMYSRCNFIHTSFKVFNSMTERDVVSWNTIVSAFVQNGLDQEALMLVREMQKQRFMIDSVTVTSLLSAASNLRNSYIGRQTHAYLIRHGIHFEGVESYLIDVYAKCWLIRTSELLFEKNNPIDRDQATWNVMIAGYTQNGLNEKAILLLREMLVHKVIPNAVTLASILPACSTMGSMGFARQLHGFTIRNFIEQNVYVGTALTDAYSKCGAITYAENIFVRTPEKNSITYTTMMMCYGQHGMGNRALTLYNYMLRSGIKPDAVTFVAILAACNYTGLVDEGLQIFESLEKVHKIKPSIEHYCCVADMLGRVGRVIEAYEFVKGLGEDGNATEIWGSLLGACKNYGYFELGKIVAEKLLNMETKKRMAGYHVLLSNIYAEEGEWDNVDRVRNEMKGKGLQKETGCSWIEIAGFVICFASKDEKHLQSGEVYYMLNKLTVNMRDAGYNPCHSSNLNMILDSGE